MELIPVFAASLAAGICASMGLGGGTVLILYLTLAEGMTQQQAQGINLVFFLPCAMTALIFYGRKGLIDAGQLAPALISGTAGAVLGAWLTSAAEPALMRKAFGAFLLLTGMRSLMNCQSRLLDPAQR